MTENPQRGEVRLSRKEVYYVLGPYEPDLDERQPIIPLTSLVQVEGAWVGGQFAVATEVVAGWDVLSRPVE